MMYRLYHSLIVAFVVVSMMFVGCKKAEEKSFEIPSESILIEVGHAGDMGTTSFKSQNISAIDVVSVVAGWEVVEIDLSSKSITVKSPSMFDNDEKRSGTISLAGYTPLGTKVSISLYVAILDNPDVDLRLTLQLVPQRKGKDHSEGEQEGLLPTEDEHMDDDTHDKCEEQRTPYGIDNPPPRKTLVKFVVKRGHTVTDIVVVDERQGDNERPRSTIPHSKRRDYQSGENSQHPRT